MNRRVTHHGGIPPNADGGTEPADWWWHGAGSGAGGHHPLRAYDTIADRDADGNVQDGDVAAVRDASADPTVDSGSALYQWDESAGAWVKLAEGESTDIVHQWSAIVGGPTASPAALDNAAALAHAHGRPLADIDTAVDLMHTHQDDDADIHAAVAQRHQHGQPLADIDDAAVKRHQHGAALADIDDAAAKRHTHQDTDADIHAAVQQRHQHGQPLADIDDAAIKRHQHGAALADIDNAAAMAHDHANKAVLDKFSEDGTGALAAPAYGGNRMFRALNGNYTIVVAPDAGSRQPTDWPETGFAGVMSALQESQTVAIDPRNIVYIRLRPGVYHVTAPIQGVETNRSMILAHVSPTYPALGDYTWADNAADADTLRAGYPVRFEFDGGAWAATYVHTGKHLEFNGVLFDDISSGRHTALRAQGGVIRTWKCSSIGCNYLIYADLNATVIAGGGGHILRGTKSGSMYMFAGVYGATVQLGGYTGGFDVVAGNLTGGGISQQGSTAVLTAGSGKCYLRNIQNDAISASYLSHFRSEKVDVDGARHYTYASYESSLYINNGKMRGGTSSLAYTDMNSIGQFYNMDMPPNTDPDIARTFHAINGSFNRLSLAGFTGGTPVYNPALNTEGNHGAWNRA